MTNEKLEEARQWWRNRGVDVASHRRFFFIGTFNSVFDFSGIRDAARRFQDEGIDCQFVLCGDGGNSDDIREMHGDLRNVVFPGWVEPSKVVALAASSVGCLTPYKNIENFTLNIPNKVIDAFSLGAPIITSLRGELRKLIESEGVGLFCENQAGYYQAMKRLLDHPEDRREMAQRCMALYDSRFSCESVYDQLVANLEGISAAKASAKARS